MAFLDFQAIKEANPIDQVAERLGLELKQSNAQLRGACPACKGAGERSLVITPDKGVFFCFSEQKGGDVIALVAHINQCGVKEAAQWIANTPEGETVPKEKKREKSSEGFKPLDYLSHDHPAVEAVGFEPEDAERIGIGHAPRGVMRGLVCIPVRDDTGRLLGYLGITEAKLPNEWHF